MDAVQGQVISINLYHHPSALCWQQQDTLHYHRFWGQHVPAHKQY